jgi:hypothetical protein
MKDAPVVAIASMMGKTLAKLILVACVAAQVALGFCPICPCGWLANAVSLDGPPVDAGPPIEEKGACGCCAKTDITLNQNSRIKQPSHATSAPAARLGTDAGDTISSALRRRDFGLMACCSQPDLFELQILRQ